MLGSWRDSLPVLMGIQAQVELAANNWLLSQCLAISYVTCISRTPSDASQCTPLWAGTSMYFNHLLYMSSTYVHAHKYQHAGCVSAVQTTFMPALRQGCTHHSPI